MYVSCRASNSVRFIGKSRPGKMCGEELIQTSKSDSLPSRCVPKASKVWFLSTLGILDMARPVPSSLGLFQSHHASGLAEYSCLCNAFMPLFSGQSKDARFSSHKTELECAIQAASPIPHRLAKSPVKLFAAEDRENQAQRRMISCNHNFLELDAVKAKMKAYKDPANVATGTRAWTSM